MADIPTSEPAQLRAGDTWRWTRSLPDYPAGTWTLKYRFRHPSNAGFEIVASADGTDHSVTVAATTTTGYAAGTFNWIAWVESGAEKYTVATGSAELLADYRATAAAATLDDRSTARVMLEKVETWMRTGDPQVGEYEMFGRRMKFWSGAELLALRSRLQLEVQGEEAAAKLARGEGVGRRLQFRM